MTSVKQLRTTLLKSTSTKKVQPKKKEKIEKNQKPASIHVRVTTQKNKMHVMIQNLNFISHACIQLTKNELHAYEQELQSMQSKYPDQSAIATLTIKTLCQSLHTQTAIGDEVHYSISRAESIFVNGHHASNHTCKYMKKYTKTVTSNV